MTKVLSKFIFIAFGIIYFGNTCAQNIASIPDCNCSVNIPGKFRYYIDTFETEIGKLIYHTYTLTDSSKLNYQLTYLDYPDGSVHSDSSEFLVDFFRSTIDASVESVKGEKKYESEIHQFGYPGYFWKTVFGNDQFIKTKAFVAGNRFYTMQIFGENSMDKDKLEFYFFDSFKFLDLKRVKKK
ncbi:MAG: hypothetical protein ABI844_05655, partial [Saprospiraceae bacterium]